MPDLLQLLHSQDLGHLRIVAELWGLDLKLGDLDSGAEAVTAGMLDAGLASEIVDALEPGARAALNALLQAGGRLPWVVFARRFGEVREMGAGRRDREQPHLHPNSAAETLFYRGLLGRAFFDTDKGPQEFAYIPQDLLDIISGERPAADPTEPPGRAAASSERVHAFAAGDHILDEATTLLAALRTDNPAPEDAVLRSLLEAAGILRGGALQAAKVKGFLEMPRGDALQLLRAAWRGSDSFDELRLIPGLICEGSWVNRPKTSREFVLSQLRSVPGGRWWSLAAFIGHIKQNHADFQRPAGDYDSWFIKRASDGSYLRGFSSWDEVDGALIRFTICEVMHRLGLIELAGPHPGDAPTAFRLPRAGSQRRTEENGKMHVSSRGSIAAGPAVPRAARYQLARFCQWEEPKADEYRYRLTPASLSLAAGQGLRIEHLLALLAKHADAGIPPALVKALKRWEANGVEARVESQVVLRVSKPEILDTLRKSKAARYLGQSLGPTAIVVKDGAIHKVEEAMTELGLLVQDNSRPPQ